MIERLITQLLRERLRSYPAVALTGPRQSGKTTLARALSGRYFDLEQPAERLRLDIQWDELTKGYDLVVLDEAQAYPEAFPRLRSAIDRERSRRGRFLLLGSISPSLMHQVSESLAGRLSLLELTPFMLTEVPGAPVADLWLTGGYPDGGILDPARYPQWQQDYLQLLAQRDLPNWGLHATPQITMRLLKMLAAVHGNLWNASQIGQSLGLSYHTVNAYLDFLEGVFLIRRLRPYHANLKKRLVRGSKCYWRDSGLLHSLRGVRQYEELLSQPWVGASWEGFVINQILEFLNTSGHQTDPCFFRTSDGYEIDLMFRFKGTLWAVEVKLTSAPAEEDFARLEKAADLAGAGKRILVSQTSESVSGKRRASCALPELLSMLR